MKKIISLVLVCVLALTAIGGTLAYFTDTDNAVNEFTIGKVDIQLQENFDKDNAKLMPGIDINKDAAIYVEEGSETAYVWAEWLIPAVLDSTDGSTGLHNIVHINTKGAYWDKYYNQEKYWQGAGLTAPVDYEQTWDLDADVEIPDLIGPEGFIGTEEIDGIVYNKYVGLYHGTVEAGGKTTDFMDNVYLDKAVDFDVKTSKYTLNGVDINYDFTKGVKIPVRVYGIQAAGIKDVYAAYTTYNAK